MLIDYLYLVRRPADVPLNENKTDYRSSHRRCSVKKGVLRNFAKFIRKHLCQRLNFIKRESLAQVFSCEFCEISKNTFSDRTPLVGASLVSCPRRINTYPHHTGYHKFANYRFCLIGLVLFRDEIYFRARAYHLLCLFYYFTF